MRIIEAIVSAAGMPWSNRKASAPSTTLDESSPESEAAARVNTSASTKCMCSTNRARGGSWSAVASAPSARPASVTYSSRAATCCTPLSWPRSTPTSSEPWAALASPPTKTRRGTARGASRRRRVTSSTSHKARATAAKRGGRVVCHQIHTGARCGVRRRQRAPTEAADASDAAATPAGWACAMASSRRRTTECSADGASPTPRWPESSPTITARHSSA